MNIKTLLFRVKIILKTIKKGSMFLISEIVDPLGVELLIVLEYGIVPV